MTRRASITWMEQAMNAGMIKSLEKNLNRRNTDKSTARSLDIIVSWRQVDRWRVGGVETEGRQRWGGDDGLPPSSGADDDPRAPPFGSKTGRTEEQYAAV